MKIGEKTKQAAKTASGPIMKPAAKKSVKGASERGKSLKSSAKNAAGTSPVASKKASSAPAAKNNENTKKAVSVKKVDSAKKTKVTSSLDAKKTAPAASAKTVKQQAPAKKAAPKAVVAPKKSEPAKKTVAKKAEPAKKAAPAKVEAKKTVARKAEPAKKAAPVKVEAKKTVAKTVEFIVRRWYMNRSIGLCYTLKQELNYVIRTLPVDINKYERFAVEIDRQIALYKGVRQADNRLIRPKKPQKKETTEGIITGLFDSVAALIRRIGRTEERAAEREQGDL